MKAKVKKLVKSCKNCKNNVEYPPPHTCDECDALDTPDMFMWEPKYKVIRNKKNCKQS